jgi:hypothetical protein
MLLYVDIVVSITADSVAISKSGGGVGKLPGLSESKTNERLMQALLLVVENAVVS